MPESVAKSGAGDPAARSAAPRGAADGGAALLALASVSARSAFAMIGHPFDEFARGSVRRYAPGEHLIRCPVQKRSHSPLPEPFEKPFPHGVSEAGAGLLAAQRLR